MAQANDLMGLGLPPSLAAALGNTAGAITCAGTAQATATAIPANINNVTLTAASSQTGALLPNLASIGRLFLVNTTSTTAAVIYPPGTNTINTATSFTLAQNKAAIIWRSTLTTWVSVLTA